MAKEDYTFQKSWPPHAKASTASAAAPSPANTNASTTPAAEPLAQGFSSAVNHRPQPAKARAACPPPPPPAAPRSLHGRESDASAGHIARECAFSSAHCRSRWFATQWQRWKSLKHTRGTNTCRVFSCGAKGYLIGEPDEMPNLRGATGVASHGSTVQNRRFLDRDPQVASGASVPAVR